MLSLRAVEEIAASCDRVFAAVSDVARFEALAQGRGIDVTRLAGGDDPVEGMRWRASPLVRGKVIDLVAELTQFTPGSDYRIDAEAKGIDASTEVLVTETDSDSARLTVAVELRATALAGRVMLAPLKLSRRTLEEWLQSRIAMLARRIEAKRG